MKKKVIDILPPKKVSEKKPEVVPEEKIVLEKISEKPLKKKSALKFLFGFILVLCLILVVYVGGYFLATLVLYLTPTTETEVFESEVEVNISQIIPDFQEKIIPGNFFETEEEKLQKFEATGKDFIKAAAEGTIRVYNSHTPVRSITLRATTQFLSAEGGKIFRAPEKIYLPAAKVEGGKVIPSFKDVKVVAQEAGEEYNIIPTNFSVPKLAGTSFYYTVWAESTEPMEGGFKKELKVVTEEDLEKAKNIFRGSIENLARSSLSSQLPEGFVFSQGSDFVKDFQVSCVEEAGDQVSEFNCQGKIKMGALSFKLSDLKDLAIDFIGYNIPSLKDFDTQSLSLEYSARNLLLDRGKMVLNLKIRINIYDKISKEVLLSQIKGRSEKEIREIVFDNYPQVETMKFDFWPFWIKKAPKSLDKIKIELRP